MLLIQFTYTTLVNVISAKNDENIEMFLIPVHLFVRDIFGGNRTITVTSLSRFNTSS